MNRASVFRIGRADAFPVVAHERGAARRSARGAVGYLL
jgi:hypothetical protein